MKYSYYLVILIYVLVSHIGLPLLNNGRDFLIFAKWGLFAKAKYRVHDLTWDNGRTYLFRDYRDKYKQTGGNLLVFFSNSHRGNINWIEEI